MDILNTETYEDKLLSDYLENKINIKHYDEIKDSIKSIELTISKISQDVEPHDILEDLDIVKSMKKIDLNVSITDFLNVNMLDIYKQLNTEKKYEFTDELLESYMNFLIYAGAPDRQFSLAAKYVNVKNINKVFTNMNIFQIFIVYIPYDIAIVHNLFGKVKEFYLTHNFKTLNMVYEIGEFFGLNKEDSSKYDFNDLQNEYLIMKYDTISDKFRFDIIYLYNFHIDEFHPYLDDLKKGKIDAYNNSMSSLLTRGKNKYYLINKKVYTTVDVRDKIFDLNYAVHTGNLEIVKHFFDNNEYSIYSYNEKSFLMNAVYCGKLEMLRFFVENGGDFNMDNGKLLYLACCIDNIEIIEYLIEKGVDVITRKKEIISIAVGNGSLNIVKLLHKIYADVDFIEQIRINLYKKFKYDNFELYTYMRNIVDEIDYVKWIKYINEKHTYKTNFRLIKSIMEEHILKEKGFVSDDVKNNTVNGYIELLKFYYIDEEGNSILNGIYSRYDAMVYYPFFRSMMYVISAEDGNLDLIKYLDGKKNKFSSSEFCVKYVIKRKNIELLKNIFSEGVQCSLISDCRDKNNIMCMSIRSKDVDIVELVIKYHHIMLNVKKGTIDNNLYNYLYVAVEDGTVEIVEMLYNKYLEHNYNFINRIKKYCEASFLLCAESGKIDMLKFFVEKKVDIHVENDKALYIACKNKHYNIVRYLISIEEDVNKWNVYTLYRIRNNADDLETYDDIVNLINKRNDL